MISNIPNSNPMLSKDDRTWGMLCHLSALLGFVLVPSANVWAPLIVWLIKKDASPFVDEAGRESLNFHISLWIYLVIAGLLCFTIILIPLAAVMAAVTYLAGLICTIVAAVKASNGESYRYPLTIRFF